MRVRVIVPTYNGGVLWKQSAAALKAAADASIHVVDVVVVDSSSHDDSAATAKEQGFDVVTISPRDFDHGGTRNAMAMQAPQQAPQDTHCVVFLTQDAILAGPEALDALLQAFADPGVAVAYGRQLPHVDANPIATHARLFNYPDTGYVASKADAAVRGIKTVFSSNSFAAYRYPVFRQLGGFPENTILSEDMYLAARAVQAGYRVAYVANAEVRHSHNYTPFEEFRRYFDIGVFQRDEAWIAREFGGAGGEGRRFLLSEARYLAGHAPLWLPRAALHDFLKIVGYKLGKAHHRLPLSLKRFASMHRGFWRGSA